MTALRSPALPENLRNEMARLQGAGLSLLPLGGGKEGKSPLAARWAGTRMTLGQVLGPMHRAGSCVYGVRLDRLAVLDCDTYSPDLVAALEARFGPSPVHVRTPRGLHLYYLAGPSLPKLRAEGLPVDVKSGPSQYVAGPLSQRRDGGRYVPVRGILGETSLLVLRSPNAVLRASGAVPVGDRHDRMVKEALGMVEYVDSPAELLANLVAIRDDLCADPGSLPAAELSGIAEWVWNLRLKNRLFSGRESSFRLDRRALDALKGEPGQSAATALFVHLVDAHGHAPGKSFALDWRGMKTAGLTDQSEDGFRAARQTLERLGLLVPSKPHRAGARRRTYMLALPRAGAPDAANVAPIRQGEAGGGALLTYVSGIPANKLNWGVC